MDYLNSTNSKGNTHCTSRNMTLEDFKKKILETHQKSNLSYPSLPKITLNNSKDKFLKKMSRISKDMQGISTISLTNSINLHSNENVNSNLKLAFPNNKNIEDFNFDESIEKDINPLISYYHFTSTNKSGNFDQFQRDISVSEKNQLFNKYNLSKNIDEDELKSFTNTDHNISNSYKSLSKPKFIIHDEFFKNPKNSFNQLKINKEIYENVMNITLQKQTNKYMYHYKKVSLLFNFR